METQYSDESVEKIELIGTTSERVKTIAQLHHDKIKHLIPSSTFEETLISYDYKDRLDYPDWIKKHQLYALHGNAIDVLARRILCRTEPFIYIESGTLPPYLPTSFTIIDDRMTEYIEQKIWRHGPRTLSKKNEVILEEAYNRYRDFSIPSEDILLDIFIASYGIRFWFDNTECEIVPNTLAGEGDHKTRNKRFTKLLAEKGFTYDRLNKMLLDLVGVLRSKFGQHQKPLLIKCNPSYSVGNIEGDPDTIMGSCIVDFKCSKNDPSGLNNYLQCLTYVSLARHCGEKMDYLILFNPMSGRLYWKDLRGWKTNEEWLKLVDTGIIESNE